MSYQNIEVKITHVQTVLDEVLGLLRTKKNVNSASVSAASSESAPSSPVASETTAENVGSLTNASSGSESGSPVANAPNAATPVAEAEAPAAEAPAAEVPAAAPVVAEPVPERTCLSGKVDHDLSEQVFSCIKSDIETLDKKLKIKFSDMYNRDTKKALAAYADDNQGKYFKLIKPSLKKQFSAVTNIPLYEIHPKDAYKPEVVARKRSEMRKMPATTIWDLDPKPEGSYLEIKIMYNSISNQEFFSKVRNVSNKVGGDYSPQVQFIFALQISDTPFAKNVSASRNNAANAAANTGVSKNGAVNVAAAVAAPKNGAVNVAANSGVSKNGAVNVAAAAAPKNGAVNAAANSGVSKNGAANAPAPAPAAPLNEAALRRQAVVNQQNRWIRLAENRGTEENIRARNEALKRNQAANLTRKNSANAQKGFVKSRVNQINATVKNQEARNALNAARRASASKSQPIPFLRESSASGANRVANSMRRNAARIRTARALPQATGWWGKKGGARRRSRKHRR